MPPNNPDLFPYPREEGGSGVAPPAQPSQTPDDLSGPTSGRLHTNRDRGPSSDAPPSPLPSRRPRRSDPERRNRIIDSCLEVIAEVGVSGTSHRKIAEAADVPLGSMTYHFTGIDELLREAFTRFATTVAERFEWRMAEAADTEAAREAVVALIVEDVFGTHRDLVLTHELYTLSARDPSFRPITAMWMARSRAALERHFDPETARLVDALIEGLTLHRALDTEPHDSDEVARAVSRMTGLPSGPS